MNLVIQFSLKQNILKKWVLQGKKLLPLQEINFVCSRKIAMPLIDPD